MEWLVLIHVLSAIVGIGPTFFGHMLFRGKQSADELEKSIKMFGLLNYFPKIGGTIAVLTGILLVALTPWAFANLYIWLSLVLYVAIQIVAVGMLTPVIQKLQQSLAGASAGQTPSANALTLLSKANRLYYAASAMGVLLFILMILKPV